MENNFCVERIKKIFIDLSLSEKIEVNNEISHILVYENTHSGLEDCFGGCFKELAENIDNELYNPKHEFFHKEHGKKIITYTKEEIVYLFELRKHELAEKIKIMFNRNEHVPIINASECVGEHPLKEIFKRMSFGGWCLFEHAEQFHKEQLDKLLLKMNEGNNNSQMYAYVYDLIKATENYIEELNKNGKK